MNINVKDFLKSGHFLIMGFNSRPAIKSALNSGAKNLWGIDYFGDLDLLDILDNLLIMEDVIEKKKKKINLQDCFLEEAVNFLEEHGEISHIILTSGFDDRPDIWKKMENSRFLIGNSAQTIENVRNLKNLVNFCKNKAIKVPNFVESKKANHDKLQCPLILKPKSTGGGVNIKLFGNESTLESFLKETPPGFDYIIQEFIEGKDLSATISCNGKEATVLTVTEQILGDESLGADSRFIYCGNYVSFPVNSTILKEIQRIANEITLEFNLRGINGLDFILKDNEVYLIEVNPRFPGTMELIELMSDKNLFLEHVKGAFFGEISNEIVIKNKIGVKFIIYAKNDVVVGDLKSIDGVQDITKKNKLVKKGDPICSFLYVGNDKDEVWAHARKKVEEVYKTCN